MRVRKKKNCAERLDKCSSVLITGDIPKGKWNSVFGNDNPIHLEIGCGKGDFVVGMARMYPDINFIALEKCADVLVIAAEKVVESGLTNIRLMCGDADFLFDMAEPGEVKRIYINFCDPWHKNKHAKRRLTYRAFLHKYEGVLSPVHGEVHFKTDNRKLFEFSLNELCDENMKIRNITFDLHNSGFENNVMTEYEKQFTEKGMPIYRLEILF